MASSWPMVMALYPCCLWACFVESIGSLRNWILVAYESWPVSTSMSHLLGHIVPWILFTDISSWQAFRGEYALCEYSWRSIIGKISHVNLLIVSLRRRVLILMMQDLKNMLLKQISEYITREKDLLLSDPSIPPCQTSQSCPCMSFPAVSRAKAAHINIRVHYKKLCCKNWAAGLLLQV